MSSGIQGNRLMSIHSMLGGVSGHGESSSNDNTTLKRHPEEVRPSSVPALHPPTQVSPQQQDGSSHNPAFRASSQPPGQHEPPRFFPPRQAYEQMFGPSQAPHYSQHQARLPNSAHMQQSQTGQFQMHSHSNIGHANFVPPSMHERERERDKEEERRQRERERYEMNRTPTNRFDMLSRSSAHSHSHTFPHHHHHVHHNHPVFTRPKLTIISQKVFEEAKLYPEKKLGRWTYNPTVRLPFKLSINAVFTVHVPRRYVDPEHNSAFKRRKVWGTEIYTDDSDFAAVLVHSTAKLPPSDDLEMVVRVMPRLMRYRSSMSNELRSRGWSSKHDGLSLYVEKVAPTSWEKESSGKGFAKRMIAETHYLKVAGTMGEVRSVNWPPQKYRRLAVGLAAEGPKKHMDMKLEMASIDKIVDEGPIPDQPEGEGDETIELSMDDQGTEVESSFVEPQGPLILNIPDVLPTELSLSNGTQRTTPVAQVSTEDASENSGTFKKESPGPVDILGTQETLDAASQSVTGVSASQDTSAAENTAELIKVLDEETEPSTMHADSALEPHTEPETQRPGTTSEMNVEVKIDA